MSTTITGKTSEQAEAAPTTNKYPKFADDETVVAVQWKKVIQGRNGPVTIIDQVPSKGGYAIKNNIDLNGMMDLIRSGKCIGFDGPKLIVFKLSQERTGKSESASF